MNEAKALTIEAGKYYRTRGGKKVFIVGPNPFDTPDDDVEFPFGGFVQGGDGDALEWWRGDGVFGVRSGDILDLVAEWIEPKRIKGWIAVCRDGKYFSDVKGTPSEAVQNFRSYYLRSELFACIEIDVLEGTGLNGEGA